MSVSQRPVLRAVLILVAIAAVFGIGILAGREITRPQPTLADAPAAFVTALPPADPSLLTWRLVSTVPLDLAVPRGVAAAADGTLWVCGDRSVERLDAKGAVAARYPLDAEPIGLGLTAPGVVLVSIGSEVLRLDPASGTIQTWASLGPQAIVTSISASRDAVYVADAGNRMLMRFSADGSLVRTYATDFLVPSPFFDVAAAPDGSAWAADPGAASIRRYSADAHLAAIWGKSGTTPDGFAGCCNPAALALLPDGSIVTGEKGVVRVKVYDPDGTLRSMVTEPTAFTDRETSVDVAVRAKDGGQVIVLAPLARVLRIYARAGKGNG
jgi:hypothetical protein